MPFAPVQRNILIAVRVDLVSPFWLRWIVGSLSVCDSVYVILLYTVYARWQHSYYYTLDGSTSSIGEPVLEELPNMHSHLS